jgi:hypothetical protein
VRLDGDSPPSHFGAKKKRNAVLHVECSLLFVDFSQNWNMSTCFSKPTQYKISWKSVQRFLSCYMRMYEHGEANRCIYATVRCRYSPAKIFCAAVFAPFLQVQTVYTVHSTECLSFWTSVLTEHSKRTVSLANLPAPCPLLWDTETGQHKYKSMPRGDSNSRSMYSQALYRAVTVFPSCFNCFDSLVI